MYKGIDDPRCLRSSISLDTGTLIIIEAGPNGRVLEAIDSSLPFMINGCPGPKGEPGCTSPHGSFRASEPIRGYSFLPTADDLIEIKGQLTLNGGGV